ncbi:MAG: GNAT family N-acetyltransferase [Rhodococcus sp.]|nr:GNAT family N-acetyltransferase [Rhodococcus sp. (in: high G+C Gram-positive bacteria)]
MRELPASMWPDLRAWFVPERPGLLPYQHLLRTGHGRCRVDRWPDPCVVLAESGGNVALRGDPGDVDESELADVCGFVDAPTEWLPVLRAAVGEVAIWPRIVSALPAEAELSGRHDGVRRLGPRDADALRDYDPAGSWITATWGGPDGLAAAEVGRGAFVDGRLVSIALPFFVGDGYAEVGVVTAAGYRGRGLSTACSTEVIADIRALGLVPTWTTSPDNTASLGLAARLGFVRQRDDVLYAVRVPIPVD